MQVLLFKTLLDRARADCLVTDARAVGFDNDDDGACLYFQSRDGRRWREQGRVVVGADGIYSALRQQMCPDEGAPIWGGAVMWRGKTPARPFLSGASMVLMVHATQRFVAYPINPRAAESGLATVNSIAELHYRPDDHWTKEDLNR